MARDDSALRGPAAPDALDPTFTPQETVRGASDARVATSLPSISVDLRAAIEGAAPGDSDLEVLGVLGAGGMGRVLLARQRSLSRDVAVKTALSDAPASSHGAILAEGAIAGSLEHPAIVPVHALGLDAGGLPVLVMKRVEGVSWDGLLADPTHPGWEGWEGDAQDRLPGHLQILMAVCHALHFAHSRGVVHRDVKPQNVLIGRFGDAYLADWGVATRVGVASSGLCGTPAFLAPEMADGRPVDARTDVYLLGATLHLLLTGQPRHPGATATEAVAHARTSPPFEYGPEVPEELADLANRACHVEPSQRPASARAFRDELVRYVRHRDARALADQAIARLAELEPLAALAEPDGAQRARAERLLSEARFGLEQSLAQYPDHHRAREALTRVEALADERHRRAEALEREARDRDPDRGARGRWVAVALTAGVATVAVMSFHFLGLDNIRPWHLLVVPTLSVLVMVVGAWLLRARLLVNRFNRDLTTAVLVGMAALVLARGLGYLDGTPVPAQMTRDSLSMAVALAVCAIAWLRWMWWLAGAFAASAVLCTFLPAQSLVIFGVATALVPLAASVAAILHMRRASRPR